MYLYVRFSFGKKLRVHFLNFSCAFVCKFHALVFIFFFSFLAVLLIIVSILLIRLFSFFQETYVPFGCKGSVTDIGRENGMREPSSNPGLIYCLHFHISTLGKYINQSLLPSAMG